MNRPRGPEQVGESTGEDRPQQTLEPAETHACCRSGHLLFWGIVVAGAATDLISKPLVFSWLKSQLTHKLVLIPGLLNFTMDTNTGGPFSIFSGNAPWLAALTVVAFAVIIYLYLSFAKSGQMLLVAALGLVGAGALGNFVDRVTLGHVRDFIQVWIGSWPYPTFNAADMMLCTGAGLIALSLLRGPRCAA